MTERPSFARLAVLGHFIWVGAMAGSLLVLSGLADNSAHPTSGWGVLIGVPLVMVVLSILLPVNLVGAYLLRAAIGSPVTTAAVISLVGAAWFAIGFLLTPEPPFNPTTIWTSLGGLAFGVGMLIVMRVKSDDPGKSARRFDG